jgi:hypothetical protein
MPPGERLQREVLRKLDLEGLVGLTVDEAGAKVEDAGGIFRAVGSDEHQGLLTNVTLDGNPTRITVVVTSGRVVTVWGT